MKEVTKFLYEVGQLKFVKRSGWWVAGVKDPETVAEHSHRVALLGHILAKMENIDSDKVMKMCMIHDLPEARLNDLHKVGHRYIDFKEKEKIVFREQIERLPEIIKEDYLKVHEEYYAQKTKESLIAKDADLLECALQAKEYLAIGYKDAQDWLNNIDKVLKTKAGRKLFKEIRNMNPNEWWQGLKKIR